MVRKLGHGSGRRLEGLCEGPTEGGQGAENRIMVGCGAPGIERLEARLVGQAYAPHRHDTYAIGVTLSGVQTFRYRGAQRTSLPGQCHVLHPDETHDGGAGTAAGFSYRIVYIDPALVQEALGGTALPFVRDPIIAPSQFDGALPPALWRLDKAVDEVARIEIVTALADLLERAARPGDRRPVRLRLESLSRVRDLIRTDPTTRHSLETLEAVAGLDRWALARQFRAAFGTCPSHFRTMRQLDDVRRMIRSGVPLAVAAADAGFADQSHMSRQFKRAYGLTPARWAAVLG